MLQARIFTLYPEFFPGPLNKGLYGRALSNKIWDLDVINIRDFSEDKHKTVDDTPFGGGSGMVLMAEPLIKAIDSAFGILDTSIDDIKVIYPTPQGKIWSHEHIIENTKDEESEKNSEDSSEEKT